MFFSKHFTHFEEIKLWICKPEFLLNHLHRCSLNSQRYDSQALYQLRQGDVVQDKKKDCDGFSPAF